MRSKSIHMAVLTNHRVKLRHHRAFVSMAFLLVLGLFIIVATSPAAALNPIQLENEDQGTAEWIPTVGDPAHQLEGYASLTSVNAGQSISFFIDSKDTQFSLAIYRLGYYQGRGGRLMTSVETLEGRRQPLASADPVSGLVECRWSNPYILNVPSNWTSGYYVAKLTAASSGVQRLIPFIVRNDDRFSDLMVQSSVASAEAYNSWGGKSLYAFNSSDGAAAAKVSFNRPFDDSDGAGQVLTRELNLAAFLEKEGYDVVYSTDLDTHERPAQLLLHHGFVAAGPDAQWSDEMRHNVGLARARGISLAFLSARDGDWPVRFEPSAVNGAPDRTIASANIYSYSSQPDDDPVDGDIVIADATNWLFANTSLFNGSVLGGLLGIATGQSSNDASMSAGSIELAHSPYVMTDGATQFSNMTVSNAASGATIFTAGTDQWSFGLSDLSPRSPIPSRVNSAAQQITRNLLARFINGNGGGAQNAASLISSSSSPSSSGSTQTANPADTQLAMQVATKRATITGVDELRKPITTASTSKVKTAVAVAAFGAKCDSSSDDSAALQSAISASGNGILQLPEGNVTCVSNQPLQITAPIAIDLNGSTLRFSGAGGGACAQGSGGQLQIRQGGAGAVTIKNGSLTTSSTSAGCVINVGQAGVFTHPVMIDNVAISGAPGNTGTIGIYLNNTGEFSLTRSSLYFNLQQDVVGRNAVNVATIAGNTFGPLLNPANYQVDIQNPQSVLLQNNTHELGPNGVNFSGAGYGNQIQSIWAGDTAATGAWIHIGAGVSSTKISGFMAGANLAGSIGVQVDAGASTGEISGLTLQAFDTGLSLAGQGWSVGGNSVTGMSYGIRAMATNLRIYSNQIIDGTAGGFGISLEQPYEDAINNNYQIGGGAVSMRCAAPGLVIQEQLANIPPYCLAGNIVTAVDGRWISMGGGTIGNLGAPTAPAMSLSEGNAIGAIAPASGAFSTLKVSSSIQVGYPLIDPSGGRAAKLGRIGTAGPKGAAQNTWLEMKDSAGKSFWLPVWR